MQHQGNTNIPAGLSILLTGGAGFLGSAIVKELLSANSPVVVERLVIFDSKPYEGPADKRIEVVTADIRDEQAVLSACTGMDAVIHSAAILQSIPTCTAEVRRLQRLMLWRPTATRCKPVYFFRFFDAMVEGAGYRIWPKNLWIPRSMAMVIGFLAELSALIVRPFVKFNPKFSRFAVLYTFNDFTSTAEKAIRDFGFKPEYSPREAFQRTIKYYSKHSF